MMYSFIFITHGNLGKTLVEVASKIMDEDLSERAKFFAIDFSMAARLEEMKESLQRAVDDFRQQNQNVIILVDLFGGSPSNVAFSMAKNEGVDVISGLNLSMVMYGIEHKNDETSMNKMVEGMIRTGNQNIISAKKLLEK